MTEQKPKQKGKKNTFYYAFMAMLFAFVCTGIYLLSLGANANQLTAGGFTMFLAGALYSVLFAVWCVDEGEQPQ